MQPDSATAGILDAIPELEQDIPAELLAGHGLLPYVAAVAAVLVLAAVALAWWLLRRRATAAPAPSPLAEALRDLESLAEELPPLRPCSLRLSLLLRTYLAGCAQDPALYETQEEFNQRMDSLATLPLALRPATRDLLDELAGYKYAAETETDSTRCHGLIERTRELLQQLDTARQAAATEKGDEDA